jgi:hypothetical protein
MAARSEKNKAKADSRESELRALLLEKRAGASKAREEESREEREKMLRARLLEAQNQRREDADE